MENQMSSLCKIEKGGTQTSELHHAKPTTDFQINWFDFRCHKYEDKHQFGICKTPKEEFGTSSSHLCQINSLQMLQK